MKPYKVEWFAYGSPVADHVAYAKSFAEALELVPRGPANWWRYLITQGRRFVERGDQFGPRGAPARERDDLTKIERRRAQSKGYAPQ